LYVTVGSAGNVDADSRRAGIFRFNLTTSASPTGNQSNPISFSSGEVFAHGLRNEVGLRFDRNGGLWGVENGVDDLNRQPWGDMHNDNPAEELNYFGNMSSPVGQFYGYPYCWSEYQLAGGSGPGSQWAQPQTQNDGTHSDDWCKNKANVNPPAFSMPAHVAPLDIYFYYGSNLPAVDYGDAFVSMHGSWNRVKQQGYKVVQIKFFNGRPLQMKSFLFYATHGTIEGQSTDDYGPDWNFRPVGLTVNPCSLSAKGECLFVSNDLGGKIVAVGYFQKAEAESSKK
jgi:glucose/arabinose dehydrogenase